jgi:hypothetical protein
MKHHNASVFDFNLSDFLKSKNLTLDNFLKIQMIISNNNNENESQDYEENYVFEKKIFTLDFTEKSDFTITGKNSFTLYKLITNHSKLIINEKKQNISKDGNITTIKNEFYTNISLSDYKFSVKKDTKLDLFIYVNHENLKKFNLDFNIVKFDRKVKTKDIRIDQNNENFFNYLIQEKKIASYLNPATFSQIFYSYRFYKVKDDKGFIFPNFEVFSDFHKENILPSSISAITKKNQLSFMLIEFQSIKKNYFRTYKKLQNVFADLGGFFSSILLIGRVIVFGVSKKLFDYDAINFLFGVYDDDEDNLNNLDRKIKSDLTLTYLNQNKETKTKILSCSKFRNKNENRTNYKKFKLDNVNEKIYEKSTDTYIDKLGTIKRHNAFENKYIKNTKSSIDISFSLENSNNKNRNTNLKKLDKIEVCLKDKTKNMINNQIKLKGTTKQDKLYIVMDKNIVNLNNNKFEWKTPKEIELSKPLNEINSSRITSDRSLFKNQLNTVLNNPEKSELNKVNDSNCLSNKKDDNHNLVNLKEKIKRIVENNNDKSNKKNLKEENKKVENHHSKFIRFNKTEFFKMFLCCAKLKSKELINKEQIFTRAQQKIDKYLDVLNYFDIFEELEKIKKIVFSQKQNVLFDFLKRRTFNEIFEEDVETKLFESVLYYKHFENNLRRNSFDERLLLNINFEIRELIETINKI